MNGKPGELAAHHAVVVFKNDQEALLLKHLKEELHADPLKKALFATLNLALPIVLLLIGQLGPLVIRLVVEEANKELDKLHSHPDSEERFVHKPKKSKLATTLHAQLTVLWMFGEIGPYVTRLVDLELVPELEQ